MNPLNWLSSLLSRPKKTRNPSIYALNHAILNIPLPPPSMWMNLGYWKETTDFPTACTALLNEVLITASLIERDRDPDAENPLPHRRLHLLDVGIGCGDQSLHLLSLTRSRSSPDADGNGNTETETETEASPLFDSYIGITSVPVQAEYASRRVQAHQERNTQTQTKASIFCADAANPSSWTQEIHSALSRPTRHAQDGRSKPEPQTEAETEIETYLLALDTAYHFQPTRKPLLRYASSTLQASYIAFDLLLPPRSQIAFWDLFLLRLFCWVSSVPWENMLTGEEYEALLVGVGYDPGRIVMRDVSEDVYAGIARFLRERDGVLRGFGVGGGLGGMLRGAMWVFEWWARRGVVRAVIVVARK